MPHLDVNSYVGSATEIMPRLWLGNEKISQDENFIRQHHISFIVNATKDIPNKFETRIRYLRLPVNDPGPVITPSRNQDNIDMITLVPQAVEDIHRALQNGETVLVHCHAGAQRSATVVVYYLMQYGKFSINSKCYVTMLHMSPIARKRLLYRTVVNYIVSKRPIVYYGGLHNNFKYAISMMP
jgi:protein-tyrosine phosphatase